MQQVFNKQKRYIIIAPHPDDEIIGCYRLFKNQLIKKIIYIYPIDTNRLEEIKQFSLNYGIEYEIIPIELLYENLDREESYLVPSLNDHHPLHRQVNTMLRTFKKGYYSIDMNTEYIQELSKEESKEKEFILNRYYPSQSSLWSVDKKYVLFEGTVFPI